MKFEVQTETLKQILNKVFNVVPLKPTMPILGNFFIETTEDGELVITANDLKLSIKATCKAQILEKGSVTLPAKKLVQLVRELSSPSLIFNANEDFIVTIKSGSSRFRLNGTNRSSYPELLDLTDVPSFKLPQKVLKEALINTSFAASREDTRYALTGVQMEIKGGSIIFAATDGKRLAKHVIRTSIDPSYSNKSIIPLKTVEEITNHLNEEGDVLMSVDQDKIGIKIDDLIIISKLLSGEFPDLDLFINQKFELFFLLQREELSTLLRQVSLFISNNQHSARFSFSGGELMVAANSVDIGDGHVFMAVNYHGPKVDVAFNPIFLNEILRHCKQETVTLRMTDGYNPGIITEGDQVFPTSEVDSLYLIMPMRLSDS